MRALGDRLPSVLPDISSPQRRLVATARDLGPEGLDPQFGAGLVDAYQAVLSIVPIATHPAAAVVPVAAQEDER